MKKLRALAEVAALAGLAHAGATAAVRKIGEYPDPFQIEELTHPVPGLEAFIVREDGTRIRTHAAGSGPAVVFSHGYGLTADIWNLVADRLVRSGRRVVVFDQRGHGGSTIGSEGLGSVPMAGDLAAVLEHYDLRDVDLVAHSMGGFLAVKYVLDHGSDRLASLTLVGGHAGTVTDDAVVTKAMVAALRAGIAGFMFANGIYGTLAAALLYGTPAPSAVEATRRLLAAQQHGALIEAIDMQVYESNYPRLDMVQVPTLVVEGTRDRIVVPAHAERLAAGIPDASLRWLDGVGHMPMWEAPEDLTALISDQAAQRRGVGGG